jgi:4-aminobutyrate aminotransferase-like enzyme
VIVSYRKWMPVCHTNRSVKAAIIRQADQAVHVKRELYAVEARAHLSRVLPQITPGDLKTSLLVNSGSEANEHAAKTARAYTGKQKINGVFLSIRWNHIIVGPPLVTSESDLRHGLRVLNDALAIADAAVY